MDGNSLYQGGGGGSKCPKPEFLGIQRTVVPFLNQVVPHSGLEWSYEGRGRVVNVKNFDKIGCPVGVP